MFIKKSEFEKQIKDLNKMIENCQKAIDCLTDKVQVLEFKQENPLGIEVRQGYYYGGNLIYTLRYLKGNDIKRIQLGEWNDITKRNFCMDRNGIIIENDTFFTTQYKFDLDKEILIQIKKTKLGKETKRGNKKDDKQV